MLETAVGNSHLVWNVDPGLFTLGPLKVRWYGLLFATGFLLGLKLMERIYSNEGKPLKDIDALFIHMVLGTLVGARLGHCLFYEPGFYLSHPLEILKLWHGGLASHGGAIGVLTAVYLFSRKREGQPYLWLLDRLTMPVALAGALIRLGNLFNSEIYGKVTTVPWALVFPSVDNSPRHPTQLYEALGYLVIFFILRAIYKRHGAATPNGLLCGWMFVLIFGYRFLIEYTKEIQVPFEATLPLHMGQLLSIPMVIIGIWLILRARSSRA